jgi:hypothetical protein
MPPEENENRIRENNFAIGLQKKFKKLQSRQDERGVRHPSLFLVLSEVVIQTGYLYADAFSSLHSMSMADHCPSCH